MAKASFPQLEIPSGPSVLAFPDKLWWIVNDEKYEEICWSADGTSVIIANTQTFISKVLSNPSSTIFKTKNFASFVRQLNLYGFRKVTERVRRTIPALRWQSSKCEFKHPLFQKGRRDLVVLIKRQYTPPKKTDETPAKKGTPPPKDSQFSLPRGLNPFPLLWAPALLPSMPFLSWQPSIPTAPSLCPTVCNNVHQLAHIQAGSGTHGSVSPFYPWQPSLGAFGGGAVTLSRSPASDMALRCGGLVFSHALSPRSSVQSPSCTECAASPSSTASVVSSSSPNVVIINNSLATSHNIPVDSTGVAGGNTYPKDTKATETKQPLPAQSNKASLLPGGTRKLKRVVADPLQSDLSERKTEVAAMGTVRTDTMRDSCSDKRCFQEEDHRFLVKKSKTDNKELTFLD